MPFSASARPTVGSAIAFDDTRGAFPYPALYILTPLYEGVNPFFFVINCSTYATCQYSSPPFIVPSGASRMDIAFAGVNYGTKAYGWVFAVGQDEQGRRKLYQFNTIERAWRELCDIPITTGEWLTGNCIVQGGISRAYYSTYWDFWVIGGKGSRELWCFHYIYPPNPTAQGVPSPEYFWERKADLPSSERPYFSGATLTYGYFINPETNQPDTGILLSPADTIRGEASRFYGYSIRRDRWYRLSPLLPQDENEGGASLQCEYYPEGNDIYLKGRLFSNPGTYYAALYTWRNNTWNTSNSNFPFHITNSDMTFGRAWVIPPVGGPPQMRSGCLTIVCKYIGGPVGSCTLYLGKSQPAPAEGGGQSGSVLPAEDYFSILPNPGRKGESFLILSREEEKFSLYDPKGNLISTLNPKERFQIKSAGVYFVTNNRKRVKLLVY
uniref:Uncharacterized protein n=1 Tax=candidate division WOR-3 bacterium TaxID=2052148 RepID=A0A7C3Z2P8_UNCW3